MGGVKAHVVDTGEVDEAPRDTVVLIHGFVCSSWAWRANIDALAQHRRVLAPCQKGFGWTGAGHDDFSIEALARFLLGVLDARGVRRATFVGNSLGGAVSLWIAAHHPERVSSLVLVNSLAVRWRLPRWAFKTQVSGLAPLYRRLATPGIVRTGLQLAAYRGLMVDHDYLSGFLAPLRRERAMKVALAVANDLHDGAARLDPLLESIQQPALVVWGARDLIMPLRSGRILARRLPNARLVVFDRCGHCPHEEAPRRFNALVERFDG